MVNASRSAGRPIRSIQNRVVPGQYLSPNDNPKIGKRIYPTQGERTTNQYIPQEAAQAELNRVGKRIERPLSIRAAIPSPTMAKFEANNNFNTVAIGPTGANSMPENVQRQL